jgi:hypothetical protein
MKRSILGLTLAGLLVVSGAAIAGEGGTWVADSGEVHQLHHGNAVFVSDENAERFDLSELRDGETRVFGSGPRAVTATRNGDLVSLARSSSGDDVSRVDVSCSIGSDTCTVLTFPSEPDKVMIAIEKERVCVNGEGDCDHAFGSFTTGEHVVVDIDCDGEDCENIHALHLDEMMLDQMNNTFTVDVEALAGDEGEPSRIVIRRSGGGDGEGNVWVTGGPHGVRGHHGDKVMLRCSEGDATITVDKAEAEQTFLCPKHSTPMEKVSGRPSGIHVIQAPKIEGKREAKPREH